MVFNAPSCCIDNIERDKSTEQIMVELERTQRQSETLNFPIVFRFNFFGSAPSSFKGKINVVIVCA